MLFTRQLLDADFKTAPYDHQLREFERSCELPGRALIWQMRSGKSKFTVDTACHLWRAGLIDAVLLFAPNGVHENWVRRELPLHLWENIPHTPLVWQTSAVGKNQKGLRRVPAAERGEWLATFEEFWARADEMLKDRGRLAWFAFNSESMTRKDVRNLVARVFRRRRVLVIFDESHDYRQPGSKRTKMARSLAYKAPFRRILTGTPILNSPLHAFSQYELVAKQALGWETFEEFKARYARYEMVRHRGTGRQFPQLAEYVNMEELRERMAEWSSVVLRGDCGDLPDIIPSERRIELSAEQVRVYRELHGQFVVDLDASGGVSVGENTNRVMKLQQVVSGFLIDEFKRVHDFAENPRLDALVDEVYLTSGKFIVWCVFQEDIRRVCEALRARGYKVLEYHGGTSPEDKRKAREAFAPGADNDVNGLVGHPKSGGQGLDLSEAGKIIWYSSTPDAIVRNQADERATKMGGRNVPVVHLRAPGIDDYWEELVTERRELSDQVAGEGMKEVLRRIAI
jgi:SNF2 family DNA or RNA helicase